MVPSKFKLCSFSIEDNQLLFRVSPYFSQMNASGVVDRLSDANIQALLRQEFQMEIIRAGIGDRVIILKFLISLVFSKREKNPINVNAV